MSIGDGAKVTIFFLGETPGALRRSRRQSGTDDLQSKGASPRVYIDLNMVRAGVVSHPGEWKDSGFREIQKPPKATRSSIFEN
jgi:hypothetical protein